MKVSKDKKKQFDVLKGLINRSDVEYLVNGCDAGREGELIFQRVYVLAGCRKPVKRLLNHIGVRPHKEKINISKEFINKTKER